MRWTRRSGVSCSVRRLSRRILSLRTLPLSLILSLDRGRELRRKMSGLPYEESN